jgi:hypothetical protein
MASSGYAQKVGWTVGLRTWLDSPESKVSRYWRAIEYGEEWNADLIGLWGKGRSLDPFREGEGQLFAPFGKSSTDPLKRARKAFWYYITGGKMGKPNVSDLEKLGAGSPSNNRRVFWWIMTKAPVEKIPFVSGHAHGNIAARHYYEHARTSFNPLVVEVAALQRGVATLMGGVFKRASARSSMARQTNQGPRSGFSRQEVSDVGPLLNEQGIVTVTASAGTQDFLRTGSGQFPSGPWQQMLIEVNRQVAKEFQLAVVAEMEAGQHLRPATGELIRATRDVRNREPH